MKFQVSLLIRIILIFSLVQPVLALEGEDGKNKPQRAKRKRVNSGKKLSLEEAPPRQRKASKRSRVRDENAKAEINEKVTPVTPPDLPEEVWLHIFDFAVYPNTRKASDRLQSYETILAIADVDTQARRLVTDPLFLENFIARIPDPSLEKWEKADSKYALKQAFSHIYAAKHVAKLESQGKGSEALRVYCRALEGSPLSESRLIGYQAGRLSGIKRAPFLANEEPVKKLILEKAMIAAFSFLSDLNQDAAKGLPVDYKMDEAWLQLYYILYPLHMISVQNRVKEVKELVWKDCEEKKNIRGYLLRLIAINEFCLIEEERTKILILASENGDAIAQYMLSQRYKAGKHLQQDLTKVLEWLTKAAERGHLEAQYELGLWHHRGEGGTANPEEAVKWFKMAAEEDHGMAQLLLSDCYMIGRGIPKDTIEAVKWLESAVKLNVPDAHFELYKSYMSGEGVSQNLAVALRCLASAAALDLPEAQFELGKRYMRGDGVRQNWKKALTLFTKAKAQGHLDALYNIALCYENGYGVERNLEKAKTLYSQATGHGHMEAQYKLGLCYEREDNNEGGERLDMAVALYTQGAQNGHKQSLYRLGQAAEQNHVEAQRLLGMCYAEGNGVPRNVERAIFWLSKVKEQREKDFNSEQP